MLYLVICQRDGFIALNWRFRRWQIIVNIAHLLKVPGYTITKQVRFHVTIHLFPHL